MTEAVTCFMMETEPCEEKHAGFIPKNLLSVGPCSVHKSGHRLVVGIPLNAEFEHATSLLPLKCECGDFEFTEDNASVWTSTTTTKFTNPKTGKVSGNVHSIATPGAMWYCPWLVDVLADKKDTSFGILSSYYIRDWLGKRDPICVKLPNGSDWVVDQKASNGEGWIVTGEAPVLTATPSILVRNYHSWLTNGILGADPSCPGIT